MMNNLNEATRKRTVDIQNNLNIKDTNEKTCNKESIDSVIHGKKLNVASIQEDEEDIEPSEDDVQRVRERKLKRALGIVGWVFCCPLMIMALAVRDKPDPNDADEWKDDPCMPWLYDVNFKYPSDYDDADDRRNKKRL